MLHEIYPWKFHNEYIHSSPQADDFIMEFKNTTVLVQNSPELVFPRYQEWKSRQCSPDSVCLVYAFSLENTASPQNKLRFFLVLRSTEDNIPEPSPWCFIPCRDLRYSNPTHHVFSMTVGLHLYLWYSTNRFCGTCGKPLKHGIKERNLVCPHCNSVVYPRISPCIIVAVKDRDRLLLTRYPRPGAEYSLVAGFIEIGETPEQCVAREAMEETGIQVKNIQYFASQPWGFSGSLCIGFIAELDGDDQIRVDKNELAEALWIHRKDIPTPSKTRGSITGELIERFIRGEF